MPATGATGTSAMSHGVGGNLPLSVSALKKIGIMLAGVNPESSLKVGVVPAILLGGVGGGLMGLGGSMISTLKIEIKPWRDAP